jgi:hypothetical protein
MQFKNKHYITFKDETVYDFISTLSKKSHNIYQYDQQTKIQKEVKTLLSIRI